MTERSVLRHGLASNLLLILVLSSSWNHVEGYNNTCILPKQTPGSPIRPQVSTQFSVHVEATFLDKNRTVEVTEYFDYNNNRGRLRQLENGTVTDYYYDYSTNELLVVSPDLYKCEVQQLNTSNYVYLLGDNNGHIFSPAAALRFGGQAGGGQEVYTGESQVRGISVHQWKSCQDWPQVRTFMYLTWSFVDNLRWVSSAAASSVPVECHVTGKVYAEDGSYRSFEHLYEFVHYSDAPFPPQTFQIPSGIVCPGRENTDPLPTLPSSMQFTGQTVSEVQKTFTYTQEKYDARTRLVIFEYLGSSPFTTRYGTDSLTVVSDFNTGTEYILDVKRGNCSISSVTSDPDLAGLADPVTLRLKSAAGILDLTGADYTYVGERTIRGVPCKTWIAEKSNFVRELTINTTYEWAFSQPGWRNLNDPGGVDAVPVQLIQTLENGGSRQQSVKNVYDFTANVPDILDGVSVDSCFIGLPRNLVVFSISNVYKTLLQYFQQEFQHAVRHSVAEVLSISPLRVANIQYRLQQFSVDVWLDLLSVAPVQGHVVNPTQERSLDDATQDLIAAVKGNRLVIELFGYSSRPTYIAADPRSLRISRFNQVQQITNRVTPVPPTPIIHTRTTAAAAAGDDGHRTTLPASDPQHLCQQYASGDKTYSAGVMAGTAVGMGVVGGGLGLLTHRLILRSVS